MFLVSHIGTKSFRGWAYPGPRLLLCNRKSVEVSTVMLSEEIQIGPEAAMVGITPLKDAPQFAPASVGLITVKSK